MLVGVTGGTLDLVVSLGARRAARVIAVVQLMSRECCNAAQEAHQLCPDRTWHENTGTHVQVL